VIFIIVLKLGQKLSFCVSPQTAITGASYTKKKCQECFQLTENRLKGIN